MKRSLKYLFLIYLICLSSCKQNSEKAVHLAMAIDGGSVSYSYGETNEELDWIAINIADKIGQQITTNVVLVTSSSGRKEDGRQYIQWNGDNINLKRGDCKIYDLKRNVILKFKKGLRVDAIIDEINKNGLKYNFKLFLKENNN